ncbi:MAG: hypothetical protein C4289_17865 [Chloroflexota bacterium]
MPNGRDATEAAARAHEAWLAEVREKLLPVRGGPCGLWERWSVVQYLEREFLPRYQKEREALEKWGRYLPAPQADHLWALGELLDFQRAQIADLVRLCKTGPAIAPVAHKFMRALECWCSEAERALAG